jgi:hypothetical protein
MLSFLYDPESYFGSHDPGLLGPALAVGGVIALSILEGSIRLLARSSILAEAAPRRAGDVAGMSLFGGVIGLVLAVLWVLFVLAYYAGGFHALSALFDGEGSFAATAWVAGLGFTPKLLTESVNLLVAVYVVSRWAQMDPYAVATGQEVVLGPIAVGLIALVPILTLPWSAFIWYKGLKAVRDLDRTGAAVAVGVPVGVALVFDLVVMVGAAYTVAQV